MTSSLTAVPTIGDSTDILAVANSPIMWIGAVGVFITIFVQTFFYVRAVRVAGPQVGMPLKDVGNAFRAGAVASIGPSLAVVLVALALLALFGTPGVLVRIGLIGSAAAETASAGIASQSMNATLGGPDYTQAVFAVAITAMTLSGAMWMLVTLILTPIMRRGSGKLAQTNPAAMAIIPAAALLGAFSMIAVSSMAKDRAALQVVLASAAVMAVCLLIAERLHQKWLKEWALGISIIVAIGIAFAVHPAA